MSLYLGFLTNQFTILFSSINANQSYGLKFNSFIEFDCKQGARHNIITYDSSSVYIGTNPNKNKFLFAHA